MTVTELATLPMVAGTDVTDKSSDSGKVFADLLSTVSRQDGFEELWYGKEEESPDVTQLFINWKNIEDHHRFMKSDDYTPFMKSFGSLLSGPPNLTHYTFNTSGSQKVAYGAPITELITFYLPAHDAEFESNLQKFCEIVAKDSEGGLLGAASGWSVEDVEHEKFGDDKKGKAFVTALGWQSLEAHMAFRDTQSFKENIGMIRGAPSATEMHHVKMIAN